MLDILYIRQNRDIVKKAATDKNVSVDIDKLLTLDNDRRDLQQSIEKLRKERNEVSAQMKGGAPSPELVNEGRRIKDSLREAEAALEPVEREYWPLLKSVPNIPTSDVPVGTSEADNVVAKTVGDKPVFDFEPKNHWQLAEKREWIDKERASKVAGARFAYLKGDLVLLWFALVQYGLQVLTSQEALHSIADAAGLDVSTKPFTPVLPPAVANTKAYEATARLNKEEQTYKLADDDLWLNASAEHVLAPMYMNEILNEDQLPIRMVGFTTAFRREAGTYGKDQEGILRMHQFDKLEMESFTTKEVSMNEHLFMVAIQEYLMQQLELPYQVLLKCTADIGGPNARGVDLEVWLPGQNKYRETHTADYMSDYQTRRLQTRVRRASGELELTHTNDATALAMRPLIGILENYQQADGSVKIPTVLQSLMGGRVAI